ncbi:Uncharacterised protein [Aquipseudomonas alcaligenes]|nr:Uncharacterised protein [Pseudomonas alcaligenes]
MNRWTLIAAFLLAGCTKSMPPVPESYDQSLLERCPDLQQVPVAEDGTGDPAELTLADVSASGLYLECQRRHDGLVDAIKAREAAGR